MHSLPMLPMFSKAIVFSLVIASIGWACTSPDQVPSGPTITFCEISDQPCRSDHTEFLTGQKLQVRLDSDTPFEEQQIIGKILRLTEADTIPLGVQVISPAPDQQSIVQHLPFHEFGAQAAGTFLIKFVDGNDQAIAEKTLTIIDN